MPRTEDFRVVGLDCAEEVAALRKALADAPGVHRLDFDILNARMSVAFDGDAITPDEIVARVAKTGLKAIPWAERMEDQNQSWWADHGRLVTTAVSGTLLAAGFVVHWVLHGSFIDALTSGHGVAGHRFPLAAVAIYLAAMAAGAWYLAPRALGAARRLQPDMNLLMLVAAVGAVVIGEWFEGATVVFLFSVALLLEHWSVGRARRAIGALLDLTPPTARTVCPHHGDVHEVGVDEVDVGAVCVVRPGERIPLDGAVTKGATTVNQAPITGESAPVPKTVGDEVYAGTINEGGAIEFEVTRPADDTTLARIVHLVQETRSRRAPTQQWVDRFARYYTPAMMAVALAVAVAPPLALGAGWMRWLYRALVILVIACPCAMVISTPVGIVSALTSAARNGVLVKGGLYLEAAGRTRAVALDKTGTLTHGRPEVQEVVSLEGHPPEEVLERAAALEVHSQHPLAKAVLRRAEQDGVAFTPADEFQEFRGEGAEARVNGRRYWIGSHRMMHDEGVETAADHRQAEAMEDVGHSVVAVGHDDHVCGLISLADGLRPDAAAAVDALRQAGVEAVVMLTGDNHGTADAVARAVGVEQVHAELLPEGKLEAVKALVAEHEHVAMIGDGINDAPAMAAATYGVAMGAMGTDVAIEAADVTLVADDLLKLPWLIRHARRALRVIKQNIAFALGLKALFIGLTFFGLATLWMAIVADMGASLLVIFNSLRLLRPGRE